MSRFVLLSQTLGGASGHGIPAEVLKGHTLPSAIIPNAVYTTSESARHLRVSERHLRKLIKAGKLHPLAYSVSKHLFSGAELLRVLGGEEAAS